MYPLLNRIENPEDVKKLTVRELEQLASELRHFIIDTVSQNGGHLAPNLGTVELSHAMPRARRTRSSPSSATVR